MPNTLRANPGAPLTLGGRGIWRAEEACEELVSGVAVLVAEAEREMEERGCEEAGLAAGMRLAGWGRGISEGGTKVVMRVLGGEGAAMAGGRGWVLLVRWEAVEAGGGVWEWECEECFWLLAVVEGAASMAW